MLTDVLKVIKKSDVVLEVLDSREPDLTRSPKIENYVKKLNKGLILVLNKGDLVPRDVVEKWTKYFIKQDLTTVYISATNHMGTRILRHYIREKLKGNEGVVCFVGYPKTGKSSIINALKGKHSATTSAHPMSYGYTKTIQKFRIDTKIYAWDTPGVIPPDGSELERIIRGYPVEKLDDPVRAALILISRIIQFDKNSLISAYKTDFTDGIDLLKKIAIKRGWFYKKDKEPLIEEAARQLIRDYHDGKITYFTLPPLDNNNENKVSNI
ncbi:GTPase RsgA [Acidianus sulfidivorans JP7]|uniref:GTP-binding protein n=1 Tax=Acidianus sulfidivorans JP7 TaxID=619593 RepID=A0A2U9INN8_9CREN|nr:GTPase [Acidianus sulfidivorans]AWR97597.1 GTPase RsgA [Acidianus sulfidivorans JP7]